MENTQIAQRDTIDRIKQMERCFDELQAALDHGSDTGHEAFESRLQKLICYYESGLWLRDYEQDEQGLLPRDLKRGVLAQDAVYDLLRRIDELRSVKQSGRRKDTEEEKR